MEENTLAWYFSMKEAWRRQLCFLGVEPGNYCNLTLTINVLKEGRKPILRFYVLYEGYALYIVIKFSWAKATGKLKPI